MRIPKMKYLVLPRKKVTKYASSKPKAEQRIAAIIEIANEIFML
jgi:hypothetical protein